MSSFTRNVPLLAACQALMMSANSLIVTTSALVGFALAEDKSLATLPLAIQFIATMFTSIPAAMTLKRIGHKAGFLFATLFGLAGASLATYAILHHQFWYFVMSSALIGMFNGFGNFYRFTAADAVDAAHKSRAISLVLAGGVLAAFVGPNLANHTRDLITSAPFAGSYAVLISVYVFSAVILIFLHLSLPATGDVKCSDRVQRPLAVIMRQPRFVVALLSAMLGYGVMSLVMTATPLAMQHHAHHFSDTSFVIQWHVLGMFAPSFFTGNLIRRFGVVNILITGAILEFLCVAINLIGTTVTHFWAALVLLGIGWNFLFIGGTTLLTETYHPQERAKTQAINDFAVFTTVAASSLSAGALQFHFGWKMVNVGVSPLLALILASVLWLHRKERNRQIM